MKKRVALLLFAFGLAHLCQAGLPLPSAAPGKVQPPVTLFVNPGCGEACDGVRKSLDARGVHFDLINVTGGEAAAVERKYDITEYPTTLIGKERVQDGDLMRVASALAVVLGKDVLTPAERSAMARHFDAKGRPKVVLYGTAWCGYCKKQRALLMSRNIAFDDVDVETSEAAALAYRTLQGAGFPLTYVGYRRFAGFKNDELLAAAEGLGKKTPALH